MTEAPLIEAQIEALLIVATEPLAEQDLAQILEVPVAEVTSALGSLARFYDQTGRGFELRRVGPGWRYYTRAEQADVVARSALAGQSGRLTQASLETLAVIAYLQPISRSRIAAVRGVNVDGVVRTLIARDLVREVGRDDLNGAGLLGTTPRFLEQMGLTDLSELPPLAPNLPDAALLDEELRRLAADRPPSPGAGEGGGDEGGRPSASQGPDAPGPTAEPVFPGVGPGQWPAGPAGSSPVEPPAEEGRVM